MRSKIFRLFSILVILSIISVPVSGQTPPEAREEVEQSALGTILSVDQQISAEAFQVSETGLYIVRFKAPALATYTGEIVGLAPTALSVTGAHKLDANAPASVTYLQYLEAEQSKAFHQMEQALGRKLEVKFQYLNVLNAAAIAMEPAEAAHIASLPGVMAVYPDLIRELDTDVGPTLMGAPTFWEGDFGLPEHRGEGVIVGMLDTGVNPLHASFAAVDGDGYAHTNPFGSDNYVGVCDSTEASQIYEDICNDKLIGAWSFVDGPYSGNSAIDWNSHGSHVGSTIAGNNHVAAVQVGTDVFNRSVSGVAPRANVISYKVCDPSCPQTSSVAAVNQAIADGVDVLNYSISGSDNPWNDSVDLAFLDAVTAGIFISASAGNDGPGASTVAKTGPWNAAVAASAHNRVIANTVNVTGPTTPAELQNMAAVAGNGPAIVSNITGTVKWAGTVNSANIRGCDPFTGGSFTGTIAIIQRGDCTFATKVTNASNAGATAVIMYNHVGGPPTVMGGLETTTIRSVMLDNLDGDALATYAHANPTAAVVINASALVVINDNWTDVIAGFSSRGPSQWELIKPDYTAPGVNILAAGHEGAGDYAFMQGTSMSSPHGAGAAALLVQRHPTWSPAEIKSALAMTAHQDLLKDDGVTPADYFDMGSGRIDMSQAALIGLVMDETIANYEAANPGTGGDPKTLNQPSMVDYNCVEECSWTRTFRSVLDGSMSYNAVTSAPSGVTVTVTPASFTIAASATQALTITVHIDLNVAEAGDWVFAQVNLVPAASTTILLDEAFTSTTFPPNGWAQHMLQGGGAVAKLPIVVVPFAASPIISVDPESLESSQTANTIVDKTLTISNTGGVDLVWEIAEAPMTVRLGFNHDNTSDLSAISSAPFALILDDGVGNNAIGVSGAQFVWLNRFTPHPFNFPITIDEVHVMFGWTGGTGNINVGELVDVYLYEDYDGNPANGATYRAALHNQQVQAVNHTTWSVYPLTTPVTFDGPGDIIIAVVNRTAGITLGTYPAVIDESSPSQGRSWVGFGGGDPGDPPDFTAFANFALIDAFGFPGNWLVRGFGEGNFPCENLADVPWLDVEPKMGTTEPVSSTDVSVSFDSTGLAAGDYNALLCLSSNDPDRSLVYVPVSLEVLPSSIIDVDPTELEATLGPDSQTTLNLDITNAGISDLEWLIPLSDILYDNGPWVTSFGDGPGGSDVSLLQNVSLGLTTLGGAVNLSGAGPHFRMTDDFTVITPGGWTVDFVTLYAYHTGSTTTSSFTGANFRIWDGPPNDPVSTVIFGDTATNRIVETGWTGAYRYSENNVGNTQRPLMYLTAEAGVYLDPGSYWIDWQLAGSIASGPWQPPISILGEITTGNGMQLTSTGWQNFVDGGSGTAQGAPFKLWGTTVCDNLANVSWLSVSPTSGLISSGETDTIDVTFDSTGLAGGEYTAFLCVFSNDADNPVVVVPVSLKVDDNEYTLNWTVVGSGSVTKAPAKATYHYGDKVTLTAVGDPGWTFVKWTGDEISINNPLEITITKNTTVAAHFKQNLFQLFLPTITR
jgi:uncharacterized repeat protein (TIGR02543 family)